MNLPTILRSSRARAARLAAAGAAVLALLAGAGCDCGSGSGCEEYFGRLAVAMINARPDAPAAKDPRAARSPAVRTEPNSLTILAPAGVVPPNFAEVAIPLDLVPPFRVECTTGLCDPAFQPAASAVFGASVVERAGARGQYSAECSRVGGITVTASFGTPSPRAFADAERVELAFEHDGTDLALFARDRDAGGEWLEVSRAPVPSAGPFLPRFDALNFEPGQMVSFYRLRVPSNAPYAEGQAGPRVAAVRHLAEALLDLAEAGDRFAGEERDAAGAQEALRAANENVDAAVAALALPAESGKRLTADARRVVAARKSANKAGRRVTQAVRTLTVAGPSKDGATVRKLGLAAFDLARAGDRVLPEELRSEIGGLTLASIVRK